MGRFGFEGIGGVGIGNWDGYRKDLGVGKGKQEGRRGGGIKSFID